MCNLFSITTNQAAIRFVRNLPRMPGVFRIPRVFRLSGAGGPQPRRSRRNGADAVEHAAAPKNRRAAGHHIRNVSSPHWRGRLKRRIA
jgi:hypothetical protein